MAKQITLGVEENGISFTFDESTHYLYGDGKIVCPKNSLILVTDESEMFTLKKANGDVFISARYDAVEGISSKEDLVDWFIENAVSTGGGGGIDPETLAELVSSAEYVSSSSTIDFKNVDGDVISTINAEPFITDGMVDNVQISGNNLVITFNVDAGKQPISIPLSNIFDPSNYYDKSATDALLSGKADTTLVNAIAGQVATKVAMSTYNAYTAATNTALSGKQDTLIAGTNIKTLNNESLLGSGNIDIDSPISSCTQAEYDAAEQGGTLDPDMLYIITDATAIDIDNYMTSAQTVSAITEAVSGKADVSAVTAVSDALDGKQDTLQYYSEDTENIQAIIGTGTDDGEGTQKSSEITSSVNNGIPYTDLFTQTSVNDGDDNYVKNTDIYADPEEGVQLTYHTEDYIEDTSFNTQLNINADGVKIKVNDFDIFNASANESGIEVPSEGGAMNGIWLNAYEIDMYAADTEILINDAVTINGEEVVTESWLDDYATVQDLEDTEEVIAQSINVLSDSLSGKQDTLKYYEEYQNENYSGAQITLSDGEDGNRVYIDAAKGTYNYIDLFAEKTVNDAELGADVEYAAEMYVDNEEAFLWWSKMTGNDSTYKENGVWLGEDRFKLESKGSGETTALVITPTGVTINDDAVVTVPMLEDTEETLAQSINVLSASLSGKADVSAITVDEYTIYATRDNSIYTTNTWLKFYPKSNAATTGNFQFSGITGYLYLQNIDYVNGTYTVGSGSLDPSLVSGLSITFENGAMIIEVDASNPITSASITNTTIEYVKEVIPQKDASDAIYDNVYPLIKKVDNSLTALTVTSASTVQNQLSMRLNKNDGTWSSQNVNLDGYLSYSGTTLKAEAYVNSGTETLTTVSPTINSSSRTDYYFTDNVGQTAESNHIEIQILTSDTINLAFYGYDNTGRLTSKSLVVSGGTVTSGYGWPSEATYSFSNGILTVDYAYTGTSANNPITINRILATVNYGSTASVSDIVGYVKALLKDKVEVTEYIDNTLKPTIANLIARIEALENPS